MKLIKEKTWKFSDKFEIKYENLLVGEFAGKMIRFLPCIDIWWDRTFVIGVSWLNISVEFWFNKNL
jgi:hypothetical protein